MAIVLDIGAEDQTEFIRAQSMVVKINTLDLALVDPDVIPELNDEVTLSGTGWVGAVASVTITDTVEKGSSILVTLTCTNQIVPAAETAPFNLSDTPNYSTTFPWKNLVTKQVLNRDGTQETRGSCTVFEPNLWPGQTVLLTSANHRYVAEPFLISQVTLTWPLLEPDPQFLVEFGDQFPTFDDIIPQPAPACAVPDPGGIGAPYATANMLCASPTDTNAFCPGDDFCHYGGAGSVTPVNTIVPGFYYSQIDLGIQFNWYTPARFYVQVLDSTVTLPMLETTLWEGLPPHGMYNGTGDCFATHGGVFEVPTGYDQVKYRIAARATGTNVLSGSHEVNEYTVPGAASDDDPYCLVDGPGDSPYFMKTDDPRFLDALDQLGTLVDQGGFSWKDPARIATTAAGTLASSFEDGDTVDGVVLVSGDRILIKDQAAGADNGIYVVQPTGAPERAQDFDTDSDANGAAAFVSEGTANGNKVFVCTTNGPITLGTTALVFAAMGGGGSVATDTIWDAKGDLAGGTGADTAAKLTVGANDTILMADSSQTTGLKWVASDTPSTQAFGDSAAVGTADTFTRGDHKHAWPALGTTAAAVGTSAGGSATTPSKSDHVHATGAGTPSTQAFGDAAATGSGPAAAMTDHKHAMPALGSGGTNAAAGNHTHAGVETVAQFIPIVAPLFQGSAVDTGNFGVNAGIMIPLQILGPMRIRHAAFRMSAGGTGTYQWGLFDNKASSTACTKVAGGTGTLNGTGWLTIAAASPPAIIAPGLYYFILLMPASNLSTFHRFSSTTAAGFTKIYPGASVYVWDDTPDITNATWVDTIPMPQMYLRGDIDTSVVW